MLRGGREPGLGVIGEWMVGRGSCEFDLDENGGDSLGSLVLVEWMQIDGRTGSQDMLEAHLSFTSVRLEHDLP